MEEKGTNSGEGGILFTPGDIREEDRGKYSFRGKFREKECGNYLLRVGPVRKRGENIHSRGEIIDKESTLAKSYSNNLCCCYSEPLQYLYLFSLYLSAVEILGFPHSDQ